VKHKTAPSPTTTAPEEPVSNDIAVQLQALAEQEREADRIAAERKRALDLQRQQLRKGCFDQTVGVIKTHVAQLTSIGFDLAQIAKAVGFSAVTRKPKQGTGPTTHEGWFRLFRTRAIQTYVKSHPDLAASLEEQHVAPADFPQHIPAADLEAIDAAAHAKATAKCPPTPAAVS
jgi:hypothetical protein